MGWSRLQSVANGAVSASSVSATFGTNVSAGTKLIAWVIGDNSAASFSISSVKDGAGNTFISMANTGYANTVLGACYAIDTPAGDVGTKPTITVTASATVNDISVLVQEISGLAQGDAHDGTPGTSTAVAVASIGQPAYTSAVANEYLATFFGDDGNNQTATVPSGYTADPANITSSSTDAICVGFKNSTGGAESGTWTFAAPTGHDAFIVVAFKLAPPYLPIPVPNRTELIYSWAQTGTANQVTGTVTETVISVPNSISPATAILPANFFLPGGIGLFKAVRVVARGFITSASSPVSATIRAYLDTTQGSISANALFPASGTIGGIQAFTPSGSQTSLPWELEFDLVILTTGTSGTCQCQGAFVAATSATAFVSQPVGAPGTAITINTTVLQYIEITGKLGANTAGNAIGLNQLLVFGLN